MIELLLGLERLITFEGWIFPKYLDWEFWTKLLCKEVTGYQPSILCFQEVDHFDVLNGLLWKNGFKGVPKARTGEACDGSAIF